MRCHGGSAVFVCFGTAPCWGQCWVHQQRKAKASDKCGNKPKAKKTVKP